MRVSASLKPNVTPGMASVGHGFSKLPKIRKIDFLALIIRYG